MSPNLLHQCWLLYNAITHIYIYILSNCPIYVYLYSILYLDIYLYETSYSKYVYILYRMIPIKLLQFDINQFFTYNLFDLQPIVREDLITYGIPGVNFWVNVSQNFDSILKN